MLRLVLFLFLFIFNLNAQNTLGTWNVMNLNFKLNKNWSLFTESQIRSLSFYDQFHYYEYKVGGTYKMSPNFSVTSGIGSFNTYSKSGNFELPLQNKETRTWVQFNMKTPLERIIFEHRYRAEQRFMSNGYRNRFRYRLTATVPLNSKKIEPKTIYSCVWNEIFFTDKAPYFERSRLHLGFGYGLSKEITLQTGYIYQYDNKINDNTTLQFFNVTFLYNFDLSETR